MITTAKYRIIFNEGDVRELACISGSDVVNTITGMQQHYIENNFYKNMEITDVIMVQSTTVPGDMLHKKTGRDIWHLYEISLAPNGTGTNQPKIVTLCSNADFNDLYNYISKKHNRKKKNVLIHTMQLIENKTIFTQDMEFFLS